MLDSLFAKISNSWNLLKASTQVLKADKELVVFPMISGLALILVSASFVAPLFLFGNGFQVPAAGGEVLGFLFLFLFYVVQYTVIFFFNSALVGAAMIRLDGGDPTVADGLRIAVRRIGPILGYALIAATVGLILKSARERAGALGRFVIGFLGMGWSLATFLVVPVLVTHDVGPIEAVKRSAAVLKKTWGEQIAGNAGIGVIFGIFYVVAIVLFVPFFVLAISTGNPWLIGAVVTTLAVVLLLLALLNATLGGIYSAALYRYATKGEVGRFDSRLLDGAFRSR